MASYNKYKLLVFAFRPLDWYVNITEENSKFRSLVFVAVTLYIHTCRHTYNMHCIHICTLVRICMRKMVHIDLAQHVVIEPLSTMSDGFLALFSRLVGTNALLISQLWRNGGQFNFPQPPSILNFLIFHVVVCFCCLLVHCIENRKILVYNS